MWCHSLTTLWRCGLYAKFITLLAVGSHYCLRRSASADTTPLVIDREWHVDKSLCPHVCPILYCESTQTFAAPRPTHLHYPREFYLYARRQSIYLYPLIHHYSLQSTYNLISLEKRPDVEIWFKLSLVTLNHALHAFSQIRYLQHVCSLIVSRYPYLGIFWGTDIYHQPDAAGCAKIRGLACILSRYCADKFQNLPSFCFYHEQCATLYHELWLWGCIDVLVWMYVHTYLHRSKCFKMQFWCPRLTVWLRFFASVRREKVNCEVSSFSLNSPSNLGINYQILKHFLEKLLTGLPIHKDTYVPDSLTILSPCWDGHCSRLCFVTLVSL